jgi:hypothetical protein
MKGRRRASREFVVWTLAFGQPDDRTPTHGYAATREAVMAVSAKSRRRELALKTAGPLSGGNSDIEQTQSNDRL